MRVKKAIKKIAALGVGATMMGATLLGATAALYDLGKYPEPWVKNGKFNGLLVVGDDAAPADIIGVTDIAIALQFSSTVKEVVNVGGAGAGTVSLAGDSVKFSRSGDVLEINEWLGTAVETFDGSDSTSLKSFKVSNDKGSTDVNQFLRWKWGTSGTQQSNASVVYSEDDNDNVGDFLYSNSSSRKALSRMSKPTDPLKILKMRLCISSERTWQSQKQPSQLR
ncbi:S-layer protein [Candidatus Woesearchaeota archaeon]|nr:S-layer protein [Candidatus Woesearchaeota archaeon]